MTSDHTASLMAAVEAAGTIPGRVSDAINNTYQKLLDCVTLEGVREHQAAFQADRRRQRRPVLPGSRGAGTRAMPTASTTSPAR